MYRSDLQILCVGHSVYITDLFPELSPREASLLNYFVPWDLPVCAKIQTKDFNGLEPLGSANFIASGI